MVSPDDECTEWQEAFFDLDQNFNIYNATAVGWHGPFVAEDVEIDPGELRPIIRARLSPPDEVVAQHDRVYIVFPPRALIIFLDEFSGISAFG